MVDIFGTWGPSCDDINILTDMFKAGMTGLRLNLSHTMLKDCEDSFKSIRKAAESAGVLPKILIDLQGPELRIGSLNDDIKLNDGDTFFFGKEGVPVDYKILSAMESGDEILLDDGKILSRVTGVSDDQVRATVLRGGILKGRKSILITGKIIEMSTLTEADHINIKEAKSMGVTGVMLPFVRSREDIETLRSALDEAMASDIKIYAKIENMAGVEKIDSLITGADEIVIARGDLGNSMPLWELPGVQKNIASRCVGREKPFMVVTQMLSSMEHSAVPTRAEVSDIFNAVLDGATSVMVTGETAVGEYPVEVIRYLSETVSSAQRFLRKR